MEHFNASKLTLGRYAPSSSLLHDVAISALVRGHGACFRVLESHRSNAASITLREVLSTANSLNIGSYRFGPQTEGVARLLCDAARSNNMELLKMCAHWDVDPVAKAMDGETALMAAHSEEAWELLMRMPRRHVKSFSEVVHVDNLANNIAQRAAFACDLKKLRIAVEWGLYVGGSRQQDVKTLAIVKRLAAAGTCDAQECFDFLSRVRGPSERPHHAANGGDAAVLTSLADCGVDLSLPNAEGETPLMLASTVECIDLLVLWHATAHNGAFRCRRALLPENSSNDTIAHWAARRGNLAVLKALQRHSFCLFDANRSGETPLMVASSSDCLQYLLTVGREAASRSTFKQR